MASPYPVATTQLPVEVAQLAAAHQLGNHRSTFEPSKKLRFVLLFGILAAFMLFIGAVLSADPTANGGGSAVVVIGLILLGAAAWYAFTGALFSTTAKARKFYFFDQGFVLPTSKGIQVYRFDAVAELTFRIVTVRYYGVSTGTNHVYKLTFADGRKLNVTNNTVAKPEEFGQALRIAVANAQTPRYWQALMAGQTVAFGKFLISLGGIATGSKQGIPWGEVSGVEIYQGHVRIKRAGKWLSFGGAEVRNIPNLTTFLQLVDHLRAYAASQQSAPRSMGTDQLSQSQPGV